MSLTLPTNMHGGLAIRFQAPMHNDLQKRPVDGGYQAYLGRRQFWEACHDSAGRTDGSQTRRRISSVPSRHSADSTGMT